MLSKIDYLLTCLGEEAGEISQAVGKSLRFGLEDAPFEGGDRNLHQLQKEIHDIIAVYEVLMDTLGETTDINRVMINSKKLKMAKWATYSITRKRLKSYLI